MFIFEGFNMKILFVHPSVELYGADKILLYMLQILSDGNDITVLLPKNGALVNKIKSISVNIKIDITEELPIVHSKLGFKDFIYLPKRIIKFSKRYRKNSFDCIYCNTLATILLLYTKWSKIKIIHVHEIIGNTILNFGFSFLIKLTAAKVICVSDHVKSRLLFSHKYRVVHNGIPDLSNGKEESNILVDNKVRFVLPGRYMPKKGQWFLLEAIKLLGKDVLDKCVFYLYGSAPPNRLSLQKELEDNIKNNGLENYVHLYGFVDDIKEIYQRADVLLIPSIMVDPFPTTVLESMMFSRSMITTNHGGASEIVDSSFGFLISPSDKEQFAEAIKFYINNKEHIKDMGILARKKYEEELTLEKFQKRFELVLNEFLED